MNKQQLRKHMRRTRRQQSAQQRIHCGQQFLQHFIQLPIYQASRHIACYWPLWGELDVRPLMTHAKINGKKVYLPVVEGSTMWFTKWDHEPPAQHRTNGMIQPRKSSVRLANANRLDLVVMPLVAFDRDGFRLGQGGGYYDRFFARQKRQRWRKPKLIGAAYQFQESKQIPHDDWDVPMAGIVTEREVIMLNSSTGKKL